MDPQRSFGSIARGELNRCNDVRRPFLPLLAGLCCIFCLLACSGEGPPGDLGASDAAFSGADAPPGDGGTAGAADAAAGSPDTARLIVTPPPRAILTTGAGARSSGGAGRLDVLVGQPISGKEAASGRFRLEPGMYPQTRVK